MRPPLIKNGIHVKKCLHDELIKRTEKTKDHAI
jgi:hypothetical protein